MTVAKNRSQTVEDKWHLIEMTVAKKSEPNSVR